MNTKHMIRMGGLVALGALATGVTMTSMHHAHAQSNRAAAQPVRERETTARPATQLESYHTDLVVEARANTAYRRVLYTGDRMQLVAMSLVPGEDIGVETHAHVEQMFVVVGGSGEARVEGANYPLHVGDTVYVPEGTQHDIVNTGSVPLKLYTLYSPPNHLPNTVHPTRAAAEHDSADEAFGRTVH